VAQRIPPLPEVSLDLRWVQGFLDRACSVSVAKKAIEVTTSWEAGLRAIHSTLVSAGIRSKLRQRKAGGWVLRISGIENLQAWALVGFRDPEKQSALGKILKVLKS